MTFINMIYGSDDNYKNTLKFLDEISFLKKKFEIDDDSVIDYELKEN